MTTLLADSTANILTLVLVALIAYAVVLWVATAYFVWRDARRRSPSALFSLLALVLGFIPPFLGALVYLVIRPPRTLDDERALALEERTLREMDGDQFTTRPCPSCGREIEAEFIICPFCSTQFARRCRNRDHVLRLGWAVCPYCAEEVGNAPLRRITRSG